MRTILSLAVLLKAGSVLARCDNGPCDDPNVLKLNTTDCHDYHIFTARGSTAPKPGHAGELIRQVCEGLGDCGYEDVDYPANSGAAGPGAWCKSAHTGATNGQAQMTEYAERCPDSKLIVIGFSQGGSVALDILGGGGNVDVFGCHQEANGPLDRSKSPGSKVVAAAVFGPTVRSAGQNYTVKGGKDFNGTSPRTEEATKGLEPYTGILREWCNKGDPICAKGSEPSNVEFHLDYFLKYTDEASEWVIKTTKTGRSANVVEASPSPSASSSASKSKASSTSTATPSATPSTTPTGVKAATVPSSTPSPATQGNASFGVPKIELVRGTWVLCGAVTFGSLFFLS